MRSSNSLNTCPEAVLSSEIFPYLSNKDLVNLSGSARLFKTATTKTWVKRTEQLVLSAKASSNETGEKEEKSSSSQLSEHNTWKNLPVAILIQAHIRLERMLHADIQIELIHVFSATGNIELLRNYLLTQGFASEDLTDEKYLQGKQIRSGTIESQVYFHFQTKLNIYFKEAARCAPLNVLQQFIEKWGLGLDESIYTNAAKSNAVKECGYLSEQFINRHGFRSNYLSNHDFGAVEKCLHLTLYGAIVGNNFSLVRHCIEINKMEVRRDFLTVALNNDRLKIFEYLCEHLKHKPPVPEIINKSLNSGKGDIFSKYIGQLTLDLREAFSPRQHSLITEAVSKDNAAATKILMEMMEKETSISTKEKLSTRAYLCKYSMPPRNSFETFKCLMTLEFARTHGDAMLSRCSYGSDLQFAKFLVEERGVIPSQMTIKLLGGDIRAYLESFFKTKVSPTPTDDITAPITQHPQTLFAAPSIINEVPTLNGLTPTPIAGPAIRLTS